jgi:ferredoxin-NADP reductase
MKIAEYSIKLIKKTLLTPDLLELHFEKPDNFAYLAGQFVQFHIHENEKMLLRSFSLSSAPHDPTLEFCIKLLPDGKAARLFSRMELNESITCQGPVGRFTVAEHDRPTTFIATGAGLAPIISIIRDELENKKNQAPLDLLFGVRSATDMFWNERLETLQNKFSNFHHTLTLSRHDENWSGGRGRVTSHMQKFIDTSSEYFLCGNGEMVKEVRQMLVRAGVDVKKIHFEIF